MKGRLSRFPKVIQRPEGQALPEYALLVGLIALAVVTAATLLGLAVSGFFESLLPAFG